MLIDASMLRMSTSSDFHGGLDADENPKVGQRPGTEEAGVVAGSEVDLSIRRGDLIVKPAKRRRYRLNDLLRQITSSNIHAEVEVGAQVGREIS